MVYFSRWTERSRHVVSAPVTVTLVDTVPYTIDVKPDKRTKSQSHSNVVNLVSRRVHISDTDSRGGGEVYLTATLSPPE